jgi:hypothetical protein
MTPSYTCELEQPRIEEHEDPLDGEEVVDAKAPCGGIGPCAGKGIFCFSPTAERLGPGSRRRPSHFRTFFLFHTAPAPNTYLQFDPITRLAAEPNNSCISIGYTRAV